MFFRLRNFFQKEFHPAQILVFSFTAVIVVGAVLLKLPGMVNGGSLSLVDALFTSTSAVCVTGLIVVDTATKFTTLGQLVILFLIQIGGLGIMTFSVIFVMMTGQRVSFKERLMIQDSFTHSPAKDIKSLVVSVIALTIVIEFIGFILLLARWSSDFPLPSAIFISLFHAVSAFCNAGFSLFSNSFMDYSGDAVVNLTVTTLIILGGIGFLVLTDLGQRLSVRKGERRTLSLHSKLVIITSFILTLGGSALFFAVESDNALEGMGMGEGLMVSFFQSVTARTAGFNTVDFSLLAPETLFLTIMLMFIGASPGSTGGGVKTSTLGILVALMKSRYLGREDASLFRRTIPNDVVARALLIVVSSAIIVTLFAFILLITEKGWLGHLERKGRFIDILFETVSAFGTVGLSTGVTPALSDIGKLAVALLMFIGRLGPLTIALAVGRKTAEGRFRYPEERVMTG